MRKQRAGMMLIVLGVVLTASALLLFLYNRRENEQAGERAESILQELETQLPEVTPGLTEGEAIPEESADMKVVDIDGYGYIGYLEIPDLELRLPVMDQWDYKRLKIAPCRQFGAVATNDLVIAAHNYDRHFGRLKTLQGGEGVSFTDMEGLITSYVVEKVETLNPTAVDEVQNSGYDLVLYTCTLGGKTRVTVFCSRLVK